MGKTLVGTEIQELSEKGVEIPDSSTGRMGKEENGNKTNNAWKGGIISIVVLVFGISMAVFWMSGGREWVMDFLPGNDAAVILKEEDADGTMDGEVGLAENKSENCLQKENQDPDISGSINEIEAKDDDTADDMVKESETEHADISDTVDNSKTDGLLERMDGVKEDEIEEMQSEYILPESDSRILTKEDLDGFDANMCRLARNEIYARHGRMFNDTELQEYFNGCSWYEGSIEGADFEESLLNDFEIVNRDLIVAYEEEMGYR